MRKGKQFLEQLTEEMDMSMDAAPGQSLIEIAGDTRVLIENHFGVTGYSEEQIVVKLKYGYVRICGCGLELARMTKEQLIIRGRIDSLTLCRRERK